MDTEHYHCYESMDDSDDENRYLPLIDNHVNPVCKKCAADDKYDYVSLVTPSDFTTVPNLKKIACVSVAISLWNHENVTRDVSRIVRRKCTKESKKWKSLRDKVLQHSKELSVLKSLAEEIDTCVNLIEVEMTTWVSYHFRQVFLKQGQDKILYSLVNRIVWCPNGNIDYKRTAKGMLMSLRLTDVEKFKFLATYCLREEIERMSPLLFATNVLDYVNFSDYPLIYYWYCYFRNELCKIPVVDDLSIDRFMLRHDKVDNWFAKEFFLDRLNADEQIQEAIWLIDRYGMMFQKLVLGKLNESQRLHLYIERAAQILANFARDSTCYKYLISTWSDVRNLINEQTFLHLFKLLLNTEIIDIVLTDIWTSACDNFRHSALNCSNYEIVEATMTAWKWASESDFVFTLLQDANKSVKKKIATKKFFACFCENLLENDKLSTLDRLLNLCIPEIEESVQFKKDLVINSKSMKSKCSSYYSTGNVAGVNDLLTQLLSSCPDLILEYKKNLLLSPNGTLGNLMTFLAKPEVTDDIILSTWFDIRSLILEEDFASLFTILLNAKTSDSVMTEIWVNAPDNFKNHLLHASNYIILHKMLNSCKWQVDSDILFVILKDVSENTKRDITAERFFAYRCEKLLENGELSILDQMLLLFLPQAQDAAQFKQNFVINSNHVQNTCLNFYSSGNPYEANSYLNQFLSPDLILEYKRKLLSSPNGIFHSILTNTEISALVILSTWYDLCNLVTADQFVSMFNKLLTVQTFDSILTQIWNSASDDLKCHLLNHNHHEIVAKILNHSFIRADVLLPAMLRYASADTKKNILQKEIFANYCEKQLTNFAIPALNHLLDILLPDVQELMQFKQNLINNSKHIKDTCFSLYLSGSSNNINQFLDLLLSPYPNLISEYKRNLLMSSDGIDQCVSLIDSETDVLSIIIADSIPDADSATAFKKSILFSPAATAKLYDLIINNKLFDVIVCSNRYLVSAEDKTALKKLLIVNPVELVDILLSKYDEAYCQIVMMWYFENDEQILNFKRTLPLDQIFHEMLIKCVFTRYDRMLPNCKFKYVLDINFDCLDRFLNWYFLKQQDEIKEYRIKKISSYRSMEIINTLLRRKDDQHLKTIMKWFFQNDVKDIANFKKSCKSKKLANICDTI